MKPRRTVASNHVLRLAGGTEDNDLWCTVGPANAEEPIPVICSTWELTAEEREKIAAGENIELIVYGTAHPPVMLRCTNVPIGGHINRAGITKRLRDMGNDELADLFAEKSTEELQAEIESWDIPEDLRNETLAFVKLLANSESDLDRDAGGVAPELEDEPVKPVTCGLCGVAKDDPEEPCSSCGKLDREPPDPL